MISDLREAASSEPEDSGQSGDRQQVPGLEGGFSADLATPKRPVYGEFFGLTQPPFELTPDPRFLFLTPRLREAMSNIKYGLQTGKGLTVVLGDAGTGKTTLVRTALAQFRGSASKFVLVNNPTLNRAEFYEYLAAEFRYSAAAAASKTKFLNELTHDVTHRFAAGGQTGLVIDEAQSLPHDLLEEIRLLGNIETTTSKLLNIVLSGQPELADRLNEPSLRQLKQRVALRCELHPFTLEETASYISGRLRIAGGLPANIFTGEAVRLIYSASTGIPRSVNVLCDNALISGFAVQKKPVTAAIVRDACRDFDLHAAERGGSPASPHGPKDTEAAPHADGDAIVNSLPATRRKSPFSFFS
jgi:type II secretory pathway predicted ATPase ExeA